MAGPFSFTVCRPPSTSRVTLKSEPSTSSLEAKVACDQPSSAASIWPVWFESSSIACLPRMTRPGLSSSTIAFGLDEYAAVGAHRKAGADGFRGLRGADRDHYNFGRLAGFPEPQGFLDG